LIAFRANEQIRAEYNLTAKKHVEERDPLPLPLSAEFRDQYGAIVDQGIEHLKKAIELRPDYADAMAYLNLLYRQKAEQVGTLVLREYYLKEADELIERVKELMSKHMTPKD
jgi:hypothetical protein